MRMIVVSLPLLTICARVAVLTEMHRKTASRMCKEVFPVEAEHVTLVAVQFASRWNKEQLIINLHT